MAIDYSGLWAILKDRGLSKNHLRKNGIHPNTIARMAKNEYVSLEVLDKICELLDIDFGDLVKHVSEPTIIEFSGSIEKGELWYCEIIENMSRPVLIITEPSQENNVLTAPLTSLTRNLGYPIIKPSQTNGLSRECVIRIDQARSVSLDKMRVKLGRITDKEFKDVINMLVEKIDL